MKIIIILGFLFIHTLPWDLCGTDYASHYVWIRGQQCMSKGRIPENLGVEVAISSACHKGESLMTSEGVSQRIFYIFYILYLLHFNVHV